jgi:hypothetical protein
METFLAGSQRHQRDAWLIGRIVLWHQVCIEGITDPFERSRTT